MVHVFMHYGGLCSLGKGANKPGVHFSSCTPETVQKLSSSLLGFIRKTQKYALYTL